MSNAWLNGIAVLVVLGSAGLLAAHNLDGDRSRQLLNVSCDPTRELYADLNRQFVGSFADRTGTKLTVKQSHGGSSRQANGVVVGSLDPDVVTLALPSDVELLHKHGLVADGWRDRLPNRSVPYTSTVVFVVRRGNPRGIHDWPDLVKPGVGVVTPNPKTSGNGKLTVLSAWGSVLARGGDDARAAAFLKDLFRHVVVLGDGARDATNSFAADEVGDVHLTWENEAIREAADSGGRLQVVYPPIGIRAEPTVAWVDANARRHGTEAAAEAYLKFLFTDAAQEAIARHGYRPSNPAVLARHRDLLPDIHLFPVTLLGRDWSDVQTRFFAENGLFDTTVDLHAATAVAAGADPAAGVAVGK